MGEDLILVVLAAKGTPNFDAGRQWLDDHPQEALAEVEAIDDLTVLRDDAEDEASEGEAEFLRLVAERLNDALDAVQAEIENPGRYTCVYMFGEWTLFVHGGGSWGDSPTETFDDFSLLAQFKSLREACGFSWPEKTERGT